MIAIGEVAVGLGMALGLWTRLAAIGGFAISLSLFLAVSFNYSPWYTGADIVYLFAFTPFIVAGAGGVLSLDAAIARRSAREAQSPDTQMVVVPFEKVQRICGSYDHGRCHALANRICEAAGCPYLEGARMSLPAGRAPDQLDRRAVVLGGVAAATMAGVGIVTAGAAAGIGRAADRVKVEKSTTGSFPSTTAPPTTSGTTPPGRTLLGPASSVGVQQSATFTVPSTGDPGLLIQPTSGQFVAYDALCPHAGCTVQYASSNNVIACPCHGSEFDVNTGAVVVGPAEVGLTPLTVTESGGDLYVT
jgi:thiosulfate dehydrogenase [quinone] large subunit